MTGFETGADDIPIPADEVHPIILLIKSDVEAKQRNVDSIRDSLASLGIDQPFSRQFHCDGYASRRWAGATTDAEREKKNLDLSTRRAENISVKLRDSFGDQHKYSFEGKGAADWFPGGTPWGEVVPDNDPAAIEVMVKKREEELRAQDSHTSEADLQQILKTYRETLLQATNSRSNLEYARRVNITVTWDGYNVQFGAETPAP